MGTVAAVQCADHAAAPQARDLAQAAFVALDRELSAWNSDSTLSAVNRAAGTGQPVQVSPAFATVLRAALDICKESDGAFNPLIGPVMPGWGTRFPDQSQIYHPALIDLLRKAAYDTGVPLSDGVYAFTSGPGYETPAEIRAYAGMGADAVGMSTVPEATVANAAGLRTAGLSCITNMAAGISGPHLSHEEVLAQTRKTLPVMATLLDAFLARLAQTL